MRLTDEQRQSIEKLIGEKWSNTKCQMCAANTWELPTEVFELRSFHLEGFVAGPKTNLLPVLPVICANCGNTVFVNALVLGVDLGGNRDD